MEPEPNFTGPFVTFTLCTLSPFQTHLTLVPLETVTVGTPLGLTK